MRVLAGIIVVAAAATPVLAQVIEAKARLTNAVPMLPAADRYVETSIAVSPTNSLHLITACNWHPIGTTDRKVYYGISTGGVANDPPFSQTGFLPIPPNYPAAKWVDPMTAASATGHLHVGSVVNDGDFHNGRFSVWRNPSGTGTLELNTPTVAAGTGAFLDDKGLLAIGPYAAGGPGEFMYLAYTRRRPTVPVACLDILMWGRWSLANPPSVLTLHGEQRIDPPGGPASACDRQAVGVSPQVIRSGPNAGRLVVAYRTGLAEEPANPVEWCYHDAPQDGSPDGWSDVTTFGQPNYQIFGYNNESLPGSFVAQNFPSTSLDPTDPNIVYIAFAGSSTPAGLGQNVDLYVARIQFVGTSSHTVVVKRITDAMLGEIEGAKQFFPAVTVDGYGGINLAYVRMPEDYLNPTPDMQIMYVRMPNWESLPEPGDAIPLTPVFPVPTQPPGPPTGGQGIDEYISIASSGCLIYISHFQCEPEYSYTTTNVYVTRISICPADTDDNGLVDLDDVVTFNTAFATQTTAADINRDGACTGTDVAAFLNAYTCGCGTP